jgi:hypothetical protein
MLGDDVGDVVAAVSEASLATAIAEAPLTSVALLFLSRGSGSSCHVQRIGDVLHVCQAPSTKVGNSGVIGSTVRHRDTQREARNVAMAHRAAETSRVEAGRCSRSPGRGGDDRARVGIGPQHRRRFAHPARGDLRFVGPERCAVRRSVRPSRRHPREHGHAGAGAYRVDDSACCGAGRDSGSAGVESSG